MFDNPAFRDAIKDASLRGSPLLVYLWCNEHLDTFEYRLVKHSQLERELSLSDTRISEAMSLLVERGYLATGPRSARILSYRLYHSRSTDAAVPVGAETPEDRKRDPVSGRYVAAPDPP